jgi:hypothetical protein
MSFFAHWHLPVELLIRKLVGRKVAGDALQGDIGKDPLADDWRKNWKSMAT